MKSPIVKRSVIIGGHKTSVSLEDEFWSSLKEIGGRRLMTLSNLIDSIESQRQHGNLSSAIRLFVLDYYRSRVPPESDPGDPFLPVRWCGRLHPPESSSASRLTGANT
jgi:predicted DNA-binding ribbon-helix-helix protein